MPGIHVNEQTVPYRNNGASGPKYLLRGPNVDFGLMILLPGEELAAHYHSDIEEDFFVIEGEADVHIGTETVHLVPGDLLHVPARVPHYLKNNYGARWKAVLVKAPFDPKDKTDMDWPSDTPFDTPFIDE